MAQSFPETAQKNYIGNKTYQDNWEHIFGKKDNNDKESKEESSQKINCQEEGTNKEEDSNVGN